MRGYGLGERLRCYAAVIRWTTELEGGDETYSYYLGIWDRASDAGEMYLLGRAEQNASITSVSSAKTTDDKLRVFVNVGGAPYQQDFSLADLAKRLEARTQRISDKPLLPPAPRQQAPKPYNAVQIIDRDAPPQPNAH